MNTVTPRELFESLIEKDRILEIKEYPQIF